MEKDKRLSQWVEAYTADLYNWAIHKVSDTDYEKNTVQD